MTASRPGEIRALAGARALPPLLLVLYHYHEVHGFQHFRPFDLLVAKGYLWVEFFFALSGFVLVHVYSARAGALWSGRGYLSFLRARLARLYPLHVVTLLIMLAMILALRALAAHGGYVSIYDAPGRHPYATWPSFVASLFLVQAWHLFPSLSWNGVSWFVSVEFFLCLVFPLFLWLAQGPRWSAFALIALPLATLGAIVRSSGHGLDVTFDFGVIRGLADFGIGAGLAMLYRRWKPRADAAPEWQHTLAQALAAALFLCAVYRTGWSHAPSDFWVVPPLMLLLLVVAFDRGLLARLLSTRPLRVLGEWSFAIYLGQTTWLQLLRFAEERLYPDPPAEWARAIHVAEPTALVVLCVLWGSLLYRLVERPATRLLRARLEAAPRSAPADRDGRS
ncbi:MAG TPA: acyltransferase [Myxococcota bacterium]|nr:acyltransferase [Myxococcota bacterium]